MVDEAAPRSTPARSGSVWEVFWVFLRLGLTSFGGPVAHLAYFREAFVERRKWLTDKVYADIVALCQFLPGPASSQVGMSIGLYRAGYTGLLAAWAAFTLPSAILLVAFAYGASSLDDALGDGWLIGLKAAAVAVVAYAVLGMATKLSPDAKRATIAVGALAVVLLVPGVLSQILAIVAAGIIGLLWLPSEKNEPVEQDSFRVGVGKKVAIGSLLVFVALLIGLPLLSAATKNEAVDLADTFYRTGSIVFGGGHVVLPLLEVETVQAGLVSADSFLAGYGAAQAVPGPLFTFSAYLGAVTTAGPTGITGATIALIAIFLPSALLVIGALPFWEDLRRNRLARKALTGINAGVVGILAAALYTPVFTSGITGAKELVLAAVAFVALLSWKAPAWAVVIGSALIGWVVF